MPFKKAIFIIIISFNFILLNGCSIYERKIFDVPSVRHYQEKTNGQNVYIRTVRDNRLFTENQEQINLPTFKVKPTDSDNTKQRVIGTFRNSGLNVTRDYLLEEGKTIEVLMYHLLKQAFSDNGYHVINQEQQDDKTINIDIDINKFWFWIEASALSRRISMDILTDIHVQKNMKKFTKVINIHQSNLYISDNKKDLRVIRKALYRFIKDIKKQFK